MSLFTLERNLEVLREAAHPLTGTQSDYDPLIHLIGNARYVLLGEASHGTHEFYKARAEITKRLIQEKGFTVIAWEADWPDALLVNRYVRGREEEHTALDSLGGFERFPVWMWRNADVLDLVGWLRNYNENLPPQETKAGVYGMDLYSLHSSINSVIGYLERVDPKAAEEARDRYSCFEGYGDDPQTYGMTAATDRRLSCEDEVVEQLVELQRNAVNFLKRNGRIAEDELFYAEQNARVAKNAEQYYRAMYRGRPNTWNLRDTHMVETLDMLMEHLEQQGEQPKAVVWAHNSHLGDARATQMGERGEINVGQLVRERHDGDAVLVGFSTYTGTVTAASDWGGVTERKHVRPGMEGSYEWLFHHAGFPKCLFNIRGEPRVATQLRAPLLERAIGVIYRPETERWSHYFHARMSEQFDTVIHFDESRAVEPLDRSSKWDTSELPETYPYGV